MDLNRVDRKAELREPGPRWIGYGFDDNDDDLVFNIFFLSGLGLAGLN